MAHPAQLLPGQVVDGWRVVRLLGAGTYGAVYQVEKDGRHFAMKLAMHRASSGDSEQADARLKRELGCLVHLEHANIIASRAHGRWPDLVTGWLYVVLDLVEGYTLAEWVERTHPTAREVVRVFGKLAGAVDYMHGRGVFHRDLKLGNIMVRASDGEPFILDFSAGDYTNAEDLTDAPLPPGTRRYRSPEAARFLRENGDDRDARYAFKVTDDVYALGVCLFDVLTAPEPTSGVFKAPVEGRLMPPPAREVNPRVPLALSDTAMCFVARRPEQRPPTAEVMRRMLESFAGEGGPEWTMPLHPPVTKPRLDPATGSDAVSVPRQSRRVWSGAVGGVLILMGLLGALAYLLSRWAPPFSAPAGEGSLPPVSIADAGDVVRLAVAPPSSRPGEDGGVPPQGVAPPLPPARSSAGVALLPQAPVQKESPAVKRAPVVANSSAPSAKKVVSSRASGAEFLAKCAAASAAVALQLGCPGGAQVRPTSGECPADAQQAMRARGLRTRASVNVEIDVSREADPSGLRTYGDGPIRSRVNGPTRGMPEGTMLYGQVWTGDGRFYARYTQAEYPDGTISPVCVVIGDEGPEPGYEGSKPGAVVFQFYHPAYMVYSRWP